MGPQQPATITKILITEDKPQILRTLRFFIEQAACATAAIYDDSQAIPAFRPRSLAMLLLT